MERRWLITGGGGQLAQEFSKKLQNTSETFRIQSSHELDIRDQEAIQKQFSAFQPTHVLNCAAWTNVDGAEVDEDSAFAVNASGVRNLAVVAKEIGAHLTHFSTDYVFDGLKDRPYLTSDTRSPKTSYGRGKAAGEDFITSIYPEKALVLRTSWLYSRFGKNFVKTILDLEKTREMISVVDNQVGQPTSAADLAGFVFDILRSKDLTGTFHATNSGHTSWFGFAQEIFKLTGKDPSRITAIRSEVFPQKATRPAYSVLSDDSWINTGIEPMRFWDLALKETLDNPVAFMEGAANAD
jgi:dTDP-4-dehydrorhamnose reductase